MASATEEEERLKVMTIFGGGLLFFWLSMGVFMGAAPEVYMDELFHVGQAQAYCRGEWASWDPNITTPPGLYLVSRVIVGGIQLLSWVLSKGKSTMPLPLACSVDVLRATNYLFALATLVVLAKCLSLRLAKQKALCTAVVLWLYPVGFFFNFLYYTDSGSTFFTLLSFYLAQPSLGGGVASLTRRKMFRSALAGMAALLFRQTNAVWSLFTFGTVVFRDVAFFSTQARQRQKAHKAGLTATAPPPPPDFYGDLTWPLLVSFVKLVFHRLPVLLSLYGVLLLPVLSLALWVCFTGNIVCGDAEHHQPVLHLAQVGYFVTLAAAMWGGDRRDGFLTRRSLTAFFRQVTGLKEAEQVTGRKGASVRGRGGGQGQGRGQKESKEDQPHTETKEGQPKPESEPAPSQPAAAPAAAVAVGGTAEGAAKEPSPAALGGLSLSPSLSPTMLAWGVCMLGIAVAGHFSTHAHPFVLADNRHYTFYLWSRFLRFPVLRACLAPLYAYSAWLLWHRLRAAHAAPLWLLIFSLATCIVLVPQQLLEPRYFTLPVLILQLHAPERTYNDLWWSGVCSIVANGVLAFVFLYRPFEGEGEGESLSRFMW